MIDLVFAMGLAAVLGAVAIPQTRAGIERERCAAAARYLAGLLAVARTDAVMRGANVAVLFTAAGGTVTIGTYRDTNGNGVRTTEIRGGVDRAIGVPVSFGHLFPSVALFLSDPSTTTTTTSALMSFSPIGTASSRTLYVKGRDNAEYAVRVLGATGRVRVLRYVTGTHQWNEVI